MHTIEAVWKNGVFTPEGLVNLAEGTKVTLQLSQVRTKCHDVKAEFQAAINPILPSPFLADDTISAPFDLPMPNGCRVAATTRPIPVPDPHDIDR